MVRLHLVKKKKKRSDYQQYFNVRAAAKFHLKGDYTSVTDEYVPLYGMPNTFEYFLYQKRVCKQ